MVAVLEPVSPGGCGKGQIVEVLELGVICALSVRKKDDCFKKFKEEN